MKYWIMLGCYCRQLRLHWIVMAILLKFIVGPTNVMATMRTKLMLPIAGGFARYLTKAMR